MAQGIDTYIDLVGKAVTVKPRETYDAMAPARLSDEEYAKIGKRHQEVMSWAHECLDDIERDRFFSAFHAKRFADAYRILEDHGGWPWQRLRWRRWLADRNRTQ